MFLDQRHPEGFPDGIGNNDSLVSQSASAGVAMRFLGTSSVILVGHETRANDMRNNWDVAIVGVSHSMPKTQAGRQLGNCDTDRTGADKLGCWKFKVTKSILAEVPIRLTKASTSHESRKYRKLHVRGCMVL